LRSGETSSPEIQFKSTTNVSKCTPKWQQYASYKYIVMRLDDLQDGFGLDLLHLIHSHSSGLQPIQQYRYSTHFQFTIAHALEFSLVVSW
jgi:hypothetical protein